jgi:hypothetical protein
LFTTNLTLFFLPICCYSSQEKWLSFARKLSSRRRKSATVRRLGAKLLRDRPPPAFGEGEHKGLRGWIDEEEEEKEEEEEVSDGGEQEDEKEEKKDDAEQREGEQEQDGKDGVGEEEFENAARRRILRHNAASNKGSSSGSSGSSSSTVATAAADPKKTHPSLEETVEKGTAEKGKAEDENKDENKDKDKDIAVGPPLPRPPPGWDLREPMQSVRLLFYPESQPCV